MCPLLSATFKFFGLKILRRKLPVKLSSTDSKVGFPTVSGKARLKSPERTDMDPIIIKGNAGLISLRVSVKNGAVAAPTRAEKEEKLNPCVLQNQIFLQFTKSLQKVNPKNHT